MITDFAGLGHNGFTGVYTNSMGYSIAIYNKPDDTTSFTEFHKTIDKEFTEWKVSVTENGNVINELTTKNEYEFNQYYQKMLRQIAKNKNQKFKSQQ